MVVRLSLYYKGGEFTLCEKRIGGDVFALDIDIAQQRDECPDFIGLLGFIATFNSYRVDLF